MGLLPKIYAQSLAEPACRHFGCALGTLDDQARLTAFLSDIDVAVFENEFVDCDSLARAGEGKDILFVPSLETLSLLKDKSSQKTLFAKAGIPSAEHFNLELGATTRTSLEHALNRFGPCVLKWSQMGYDGKGVMYLKDNARSLTQAFDFCKKAEAIGKGIYAEELIHFKRELAIIGVLSKRGEFVSYPVVVSEQDDGICLRVFGPARDLGLDAALEETAKAYAERFARELNLYGTFALEMFETQDGRILANEIAPRVHNSGHYSQDACKTSQFENHWRAVLGLPLGSVETTPAFAMLNYLGPDDMNPMFSESLSHVLPKSGPNSQVHWYGKADLRARRKMGHIIGTAQAIGELPRLIVELDKSRAQWFLDLHRCQETQ